MNIRIIYKYSIIAVFTVVILLRVQVSYQNRIETLANQVTDFTIQNSLLVQSLNYTQEVQTKLRDEPIYPWPINVDDYDRLTSEFGYRQLLNPFTGGSKDSEHMGIDLAGTYHARVLAIADGIVVENYPAPNGFFKGHPVLGGMVKILHTDGTYSVYGHLSVTYVSEYGSKKYVKAGDVIGRIGNTGMSYGSHLHFELRDENDEAIQSLFLLDDPTLIK